MYLGITSTEKRKKKDIGKRRKKRGRKRRQVIRPWIRACKWVRERECVRERERVREWDRSIGKGGGHACGPNYRPAFCAAPKQLLDNNKETAWLSERLLIGCSLFRMTHIAKEHNWACVLLEGVPVLSRNSAIVLILASSVIETREWTRSERSLCLTSFTP